MRKLREIALKLFEEVEREKHEEPESKFTHFVMASLNLFDISALIQMNERFSSIFLFFHYG